jgi:hypothetical protein
VPRIPRIGTRVPWLALLDAGQVAREHWGKLTAAERSKLGRLLRKSKGRLSNLTVRERADLRRLVNKLELPDAGKKLVPFAGAVRRRKR